MRIIFIILLSATFHSACWAQSSRDTVLSFIASQMLEMKNNPKRSFDEGDPRRYAAAWPQISQSHIKSQKGDPQKVAVPFDGRITRYLVISEKGNDVTVFFAGDSITEASSAFDPNSVVGMEIKFHTEIKKGEGRRILLNLNSDKTYGEFANHDSVSWREFIERGYKDRLASVYSIRSQDSPNSIGLRQLCEAQKATCLSACPRDRVLTTQLDRACEARCRSLVCN